MKKKEIHQASNLNIRLHPNMLDKATVLSNSKGMDRSEWVRFLIQREIEQEEKVNIHFGTAVYEYKISKIDIYNKDRSM